MRPHTGWAVALCLLSAGIVGARAQTALPVKQGLWETTVTSTNQISLPPDAEAKIAALPPAQQAMIRQNMGGGAKPTSSTNRSCIASTVTMDQFLNQQQQNTQMKCSFTNRQQTATGASFDTSCTMQQGTATGHSQFTFVDDEHVSGQTHMTVVMATAKGSGQSTLDSTMSMKYLGADCGSVKPNTAAPGN